MALFSTPSSGNNDALHTFYGRFMGKFMTGGHSVEYKGVGDIAAMGGSVKGGYSALADYGNSLYSSAKEKLIRGIAQDVSSMLKVSSSFAESADIKDVIEKLQQIVPDPHNKKISRITRSCTPICVWRSLSRSTSSTT